MLAAAKFISDTEQLPTPAEAGVFYKAEEEKTDTRTVTYAPVSDKHLVTFEGTGYGCSMVDLTRIIHYIFDLLVLNAKFFILERKRSGDTDSPLTVPWRRAWVQSHGRTQ